MRAAALPGAIVSSVVDSQPPIEDLLRAAEHTPWRGVGRTRVGPSISPGTRRMPDGRGFFTRTRCAARLRRAPGGDGQIRGVSDGSQSSRT